MTKPGHAAGAYVFGSSAAEITRLQELGELLRPSTRQALREAGIAEGMNVLDVGCGPGPVTFLAAELVGRAGSVTGVDRDPAILATARARALSSGQPNVAFIQADLSELGAERWLEGWYDQMLHAARNAMPVVLSSGITTAEQAGLDALAERVREAVASQRSVTRAIDLVSAWTRTAPAQR